MAQHQRASEQFKAPLSSFGLPILFVFVRNHSTWSATQKHLASFLGGCWILWPSKRAS